MQDGKNLNNYHWNETIKTIYWNFTSKLYEVKEVL